MDRAIKYEALRTERIEKIRAELKRKADDNGYWPLALRYGKGMSKEDKRRISRLRRSWIEGQHEKKKKPPKKRHIIPNEKYPPHLQFRDGQTAKERGRIKRRRIRYRESLLSEKETKRDNSPGPG